MSVKKNTVEQKLKAELNALKTRLKAKQKAKDKANALIDKLRAAADDAAQKYEDLDSDCYSLQDKIEVVESDLEEYDIMAPKTGKFICYKKVKTTGDSFAVAKLEVPAKALRRQNSGEKKFRVSTAKVLSITCIGTNKKLKAARSVGYCASAEQHAMTYTVGKVVTPNGFDTSHVQCSQGIHVLMKEQDARNYS